MENFYESNVVKHKPWKKILCVLLSIIIAFGTLITLTVGSSHLQDWLGIQSMLSAYAKEFVDTDGAVALNKDEMLADHKIIDFENQDGSNTLYLFSEPITFIDDDGNIKAKDITVEKQSDKDLKSQGYEYTNGQNDYRINFSENSEKGLFVEVDESRYSIIPQSDFSVIGKENVSDILGEAFEDFEYENIYGNGTNLKFYPQLNGVKDEIILNTNIDKNQFSFKLITENCKAVLNEDGTVTLFNADKEAVQTFSAPYAYDSEYVDGFQNEHYTKCEYELDLIADNTYVLTVSVPEEWLDSADTVYPVTIDPATSNISNSADAGVCSLHRYTNYGNDSTGGFGKSNEYGYGRVYEKFEIPSAIKPGAQIGYAYHWVRETTQNTESTYVRPFMVNGEWKETSINWSNKPGYDDTVNTNWKNINGASTDRENYPNWYNYNLVNCVKKWISGTENNGVVFVSGEEVDADQEYIWRTFASRTHETSAMRPYTVINYTNDTTAPTVTVNVSTTEFTKGSVKIFLTNGNDTGGAGIHSEPFSFSTVKGTYNWGKTKEKTYSENCTVYVSIRDKADNIRTYVQTITNIDNEGPNISNVSLSTDDWTNDKVDVSIFASDAISGVKEYSFSTTSGTYAWQKTNKKSFSENTTVYVAARDNLDNVSEEMEVKIDKIDKVNPSIPSVTGDNNGWISSSTVLTAKSADDQSGVSQYSFSTSPDQYNWQSENTFVPTEDCTTLYVYSKDKAGNISKQKKLDYQFDPSLPSGSIMVQEPEDWVRTVTITANAQDEVSGLHETPYSFSSAEGKYSWQKENTYNATSNGTYYVYVRDSAGNITLLDTVKIDKIDNTAPTVKAPDVKDVGNKTIITITATDDKSGVSAYSIDDGKTWQESNVFEIEKDSLNIIAAKAKDNVGNVNANAQYYDFYLPEYYIQDGYLCLYNPKVECDDSIYYRLPNSRSWTKYNKPIKIDDIKTIYLSFHETISLAAPAKYKFTLDYEPKSDAEKFGYSETATDLTLSYKSLTFDISRKFDNGEWLYSYDSYAEFVNDGIIHAVLPNFEDVYFVKENKYNYIDQVNGYQLAFIYDEEDTELNGCSIKIDNYYYYYGYENSVFFLAGVADAYICNSIDIVRDNNTVEIIDNLGRGYIINNSGDVTTITDSLGGVITYRYDDNKLTSVTDQTGVIIDSYSYSDDKIIKNGMMSIEYDNSGRVTKYLYDNGAYTVFEYGENSVTTKNSKDETSAYTYDSKDRVTSSTDNYGDETVYEYNDDERTVKITKDGEVLKTYKYNDNGTLNWEKLKDSDYNIYYYDDQKRVITEITENAYTHYVYDDYGNIVMTAVVKEEFTADNRYYYNQIQDSLGWYDITRYTYADGLLVKSYDEKNDITVLYEYDDYGNTSTRTTLTVEDGVTKIGKTESRYDILGRLVWSKSNDSETEYTYDAAGRLLLTKTDDNYYQRTVYDNNGRVVQEIDNEKYDPSLDNLPNAYGDLAAGQTYEYNQYGDLIKETNNFGLSTEYEYSDTGNVYRKHFDIYDYYYSAGGKCLGVAVNGTTIVDYAYDVDDSSLKKEEGQFINRITYADGYTEEQITDKYGNAYYKYANGNSFYSISALTKKKKLAYNNLESNRHNTITVSDNYYSFESRTTLLEKIFDYAVKTADDVTTINETHFNTPFKTVIGENDVTYSTQANHFVERENIDIDIETGEETHTVELVSVLTDREFSYSAEKTDDKVTETITGDLERSLTTEQYFDEESNTYYKNYNNNLSFYNTYDDDGNIISDEKNSYTYNELGELISTSGLVNSSYQYDSRGNILTKTVNGVSTNYYYSNDWLDQITSVNGVPLTYDANGNLASYGDTTYTWSHGKQLESVTNENGTYNYTYDENGIRLTKPGYTFDTVNGKILAQHGANNIYFQYNGDTPVGFILNQNQYYYITNPSGDIVGITDSKCDLIATYTYDEWGKLLSIETAEENNAQQLEIAETNPLRYRGYYYDNETGYYYLQSRYYDPELGRFISADDFSYIDTSHQLNINAYSYCWNCPIALEDAEGTTPKISIDPSIIYKFFDNLEGNITDSINNGMLKLTEAIQNFLKKYNAFIDKLEFNINHPDVVINNVLSKLFNDKVYIRFRLIERFRQIMNPIKLDQFKADVVDEESGIATYSSNSQSNPDDNNIVMAILQGIVAAIELDWINSLLEFFGSSLEKISADTNEFVKEALLTFITTINVVFGYIPDYMRGGAAATATTSSLDRLYSTQAKVEGIAKDSSVVRGFGFIFALIGFCVDMDSAGEGAFSKKEDTIMNIVGLAIDIISLFLGPVASVVIPIFSDIIIDITALRLKGFVFMY